MSFPLVGRSLIACLPFALALAGAGCDRAKAPQEQPAGHAISPSMPAAPEPAAGKIDRSHAGAAMPGMPFAGPDGAPATLTAFRGKPVLVNLWATWCAPCVRELPTLDAMAARERARLRVVAVSEDMGGQAQVAPFWRSKHFTVLAPYTDARMALMNALKADVLPTTILFDAKGREVWRMVGDKDWTGGNAPSLLAEAK